MRAARISFPVLACLLAISTSAFAYTPYHEWRQRTDVIDAALGAMPSSDVNGTLNGISAQLSRNAVEDLTSSDFASLPANYQRSMSDALDDLQADLALGTDELTLVDRYVLLQVVEAVATSRNLELNLEDPNVCYDTEGREAPPCVNLRLDRLARDLEPTVTLLIEAYNASPCLDGPASVTPPSTGSVDRGNFSAWVDEVRDSYGLSVPTVPSIDD